MGGEQGSALEVPEVPGLWKEDQARVETREQEHPVRVDRSKLRGLEEMGGEQGSALEIYEEPD